MGYGGQKWPVTTQGRGDSAFEGLVRIVRFLRTLEGSFTKQSLAWLSSLLGPEKGHITLLCPVLDQLPFSGCMIPTGPSGAPSPILRDHCWSHNPLLSAPHLLYNKPLYKLMLLFVCIFVCWLFYDTVARLYSIKWQGGKCMIIWKGFARNQAWPNQSTILIFA